MSHLRTRLGATTATAPAPPRKVPALWLALLATPFAAGANSPVLILPDIASSLAIPTASATWFVTAFAWGAAIGTPLLAGLLRQRGARTALWTSTALLTVGTLLLATAPWLPLALVGRVAQGTGGAGLITVAMGLAGTARRMGVIAAGFGVLGAAGPLLGSLAADASTWRVPLSFSALALLALPVVAGALPADATAGPRVDFDARGALALVGLVTAAVAIPLAPLVGAAAALISALLLALHVRARPEGFVPAELLRTPAFGAAALLASALSTCYFALLFAVPHLLASRTDWSDRVIGAGQLVALLTGAILSWLLAAASSRLGRARVLAVLVLLGLTAPLMAALAPWGAALLLAAGVAVFTTTAGNATLSMQAAEAAPTAIRPTAIGLFTLCYQMGGAFGPAITTLVVLS
ncbi:MFS transporter [Streptomyces sp. NPDC006879]|uniref:MFS transporter n=1 Tax=Streptomyces sp. NPDC006879 TaxID=3364767 RepID=UPI00369FA79E